MAKHKVKKKSSRDGESQDPYGRVQYARVRSRHRLRDHSRDRPRDRSRQYRRHGSSVDSRSSREPSTRRSQSKDRLQEMLKQIHEFLSRDTDHNLHFRRAQEVRSPSRDSEQIEEVSATPVSADSLVAIQSNERPTVTNTDRGVVPAVPASFAVSDEDHATTCNVSFAVPPVTEIVDPQDSILDSEASSLARELFGEVKSPTAPSTWNHMVLDAIQSESRKGLNQDIRIKLLAKYEVKGDLAALAPPKLNKELATVLTQSVVKRDEYQLLAQTQVGACLNAFGSGVSLLLKPEVVQTLDSEVRSALTLFSEGLHLLADHQYRLSMARRAFTKPSLNITGKNAADSATIDDFLFGQNFPETLKAAQVCEKTGREVSKAIPQMGKKTLQPIRQTLQQRKQPYSYNNKPHRSGNRRTPVRSYAARRTGDRYHKSRPHRSQSQSRTRRRP